MNTFGFIGMGNMGNAMLNGLLKEVPAHAIRFTDASEVVRVNVSEKTGVSSLPTNIELANSVKYIILAVKPQCYDEVIKNIRNVVTDAFSYSHIKRFFHINRLIASTKLYKLHIKSHIAFLNHILNSVVSILTCDFHNSFHKAVTYLIDYTFIPLQKLL